MWVHMIICTSVLPHIAEQSTGLFAACRGGHNGGTWDILDGFLVSVYKPAKDRNAALKLAAWLTFVSTWLSVIPYSHIAPFRVLLVDEQIAGMQVVWHVLEFQHRAN